MSYQLIFTLISGIFISGIAAYLGTLMLSKKMSVVAGPLAHLAFPGVALALIFGFDISLGVFPFVIIGAILIWILEKRTKLPLENLAAIIFASGVGSALLFLPIGKAEEALVGKISTISFKETIFVVILSLLIFFVIKKFYQKMMLMNIHEDLAVIEGVNIDFYNLLYLLSIAVVVALGVYLVGGLITAALVAIPAASAKNISKGLESYKIWAVVFGIASAIGGIFIARFVSLPTGPMVIVVGVILFLISVIFRKRLF
ncbi:MAG: metal ABC transporter permease [Xanthomonadaceae bacterium]|nr:metal ABC transporter permease [Rhodospirillaceae bacterium]NIA18231.1 metal ABC transporter permease [Xanthomonadaceae bacterium]